MSKSNFAILITSLKYWFNQLEEAINDKSLILTVFNVSKEAFLDLDDLIDSIYDLSKDINIIGYNRFQNRRYVCLEFENASMKSFVLENLKIVKCNQVVFLDWVGQENIFHLKVQWLPTHVNTAKVKEVLNKYVEIIEEEKIKTNFKRGQIIPSGDLKFKCKLLKNTTLNSIPHLCNIGKLKAFIVIPGRDQMCLTCYKTGHISYCCPTPFCKNCKKLMPVKHECSKASTYADKLRAGMDRANILPHGDWGSEMEEKELAINAATYASSKKKDDDLKSTIPQKNNLFFNTDEGAHKQAYISSDGNDIHSSAIMPLISLQVVGHSNNSLAPNSDTHSSENLNLLYSEKSDSQGAKEQNSLEIMDYAVASNKRKLIGSSSSNSNSEIQEDHFLPNSKQIITYSKIQPTFSIPITNKFDAFDSITSSKTQPKLVIPLNREKIALSMDRITTEQQFSDNSLSDDEQQQQDSEVLSCVKSYFEELQALKLVTPPIPSGEEVSGTQASSFSGVESMDMKEGTRKRKTENYTANKKNKNTSKKENSKNNNIGSRRVY